MELIFITNNDEKFEAVKRIRNNVFELEQGAIESEEFDSFDSDLSTVYLLIYDDAKAVATGRIAQTEKGFKIGRIAVEKSCRGKGFGAILVNNLCEKSRDLGADFVLVDAQLHAIPFYEKLDFIPTGENEIIDRGIRHLPMVKKYD